MSEREAWHVQLAVDEAATKLPSSGKHGDLHNACLIARPHVDRRTGYADALRASDPAVDAALVPSLEGHKSQSARCRQIRGERDVSP
jgi:hypothetical protein